MNDMTSLMAQDLPLDQVDRPREQYWTVTEVDGWFGFWQWHDMLVIVLWYYIRLPTTKDFQHTYIQ